MEESEDSRRWWLGMLPLVVLPGVSFLTACLVFLFFFLFNSLIIQDLFGVLFVSLPFYYQAGVSLLILLSFLVFCNAVGPLSWST